MALALINTDTGEILEHNVLIIGRKPKYIDRGYIKIFVTFLQDIVSNSKVSGKAIRLLLYMIERLNFNDLTVYIDYKEAIRDLGISPKTFYNWIRILEEEGYIQKVKPYIYRVKAYSAVKGDMGKAMENEIQKSKTEHSKKVRKLYQVS